MAKFLFMTPDMARNDLSTFNLFLLARAVLTLNPKSEKSSNCRLMMGPKSVKETRRLASILGARGPRIATHSQNETMSEMGEIANELPAY